ncbi:MAG: hypothetical protein QOH73_1145 [Gaiellaceae bacterium]|nr:hypothetical protein [Gaiellaceae bacterium]
MLIWIPPCWGTVTLPGEARPYRDDAASFPAPTGSFMMEHGFGVQADRRADLPPRG